MIRDFLNYLCGGLGVFDTGRLEGGTRIFPILSEGEAKFFFAFIREGGRFLPLSKGDQEQLISAHHK